MTEIKAAYETSNVVGTCLGTGIKGTGMGLHSAKGAFIRCQENAVLAASCLSDEEFAALAEEAGFDSPEALVEALTNLPTIS